MPPAQVHKFYGLEPSTEGDALVRDQAFAKNAKAFYNNEEEVPMRGPAPQGFDKAAQIFFGQDEVVKGQSQGRPIPGTCTFRPRVEADNIFAQTYGSSLDCSSSSAHRINNEKSETLRGAQQWLAYDQAVKVRAQRGV